MSFNFTNRRGLRKILTRGPVVDNRLDLTLECGHTVNRDYKATRNGATLAQCPTCKRSDGEARDKANKGAA